MSSSVSMSGPTVELLAEKIMELQERLQKAAPGYESLLHTIHRQLSADESLVHLLTEEQIGVIVVGLTRRKNIVLAEPDKLKKSSSGRGLKNIQLEDLE